MTENAHEILIRRLREGYTIPSLSVVVLRLVKLAADERSSAADLAKLIEEDPALSVSLLKLANSAFYKGQNPIASLQQAVSRVGFQRLRIMALSLSLRSSFPMGKVGPMDYEKFWRASMYRALLADSIARKLKIVNSDEAFAAGLTLQVGLLVFFDLFVRDRVGDFKLDFTNLPEFLAAQQKEFNIDHRQIGREVLKEWNFPTEIIACQDLISFTSLPPDVTELGKVITLAMELAMLVFEQATDYQAIFVAAEKELALSPPELNIFLQDCFGKMEEIADSLIIDETMRDDDLMQLMELAREAMGHLAGEVAAGPVSSSGPAKKISYGKGTVLFARYRIDKRLGQGSMGTVYLAHDLKLVRKVAVKTLRFDQMISPEKRQQAGKYFLQEARVTGNLNHSHITTIYDIGIEDGIPYLIMEYIEGYNLKELIDKRVKFSLEEKLSIISMIARALDYAHQRGIIHRDIKPANIMILKNRLPKITDFGIAKILDAAPAINFKKIDDGDVIFGTPKFMSPEQIRRDELDNRSDIFSLGVLAYNWISLRNPFQGKTIMETMRNILELPPPPLPEVGETDKELERIIARALAKKPARRYQNAEDFSDALELYIDKLNRLSQVKKASFRYDKNKVVRNLRKKYRFFANFSIDELFTIFKLSHREGFKKGEYVIRQGGNGTKFYIIIFGSMAVEREVDGKKVEVTILPAGSCVGEMAIVDRLPRSASVVAREPTQTIAINEAVLRHLQPRLCLKLYRNLAAIISERLRNIDSRL